MTIELVRIDRPTNAQLGQRVDIGVVVFSNASQFDPVYRVGVSCMDSNGIPLVAWDHVGIGNIEYDSPVISDIIDGGMGATFTGHYYQTEDVAYPLEVRLYYKNSLTPEDPWTIENEVHEFSVPLQNVYYGLELRLVQGSGNLYQDDNAFLAGSYATIRATPHTGYAFDHWRVTWGGAIVETFGDSELLVHMTDNVVAEAFFRDVSVPPAYYYLTVNATAGGTWSGAKTTYSPGEVATITALPDTGYEFVKWVIAGQTVMTPTASFTMNSNKTATATFKLKGTVPPPDGNGTGVGTIAIVVLVIAALALSGKKS